MVAETLPLRGCTLGARLLRSRSSARAILVYSNRAFDEVTFREQIETLERQLDLKVFHVLSRPDPSWKGLRGRITPAILADALPADLSRWAFFLCGSGPAVDTSFRALVHLNIPPERIHAERFVEV